MLPDVATPRLQMKVRAMIRPNKVSEIRSIGSSTRPDGLSETSDIESNAPWLTICRANSLAIFQATVNKKPSKRAVRTRRRWRPVKCWQYVKIIVASREEKTQWPPGRRKSKKREGF